MKERVAEPHLFVVFGATGDLARRKLLPAVQRLSRVGALGGGQRVLGVARDRGLDEAGWRKRAREALAEAGTPDLDHWCDGCLYYQPLDAGKDDYAALRRRIEEIEAAEELPGNRLFYLAVPPQVFPDVVEGLGEVGLHQSAGFTRIVFEKPFGNDLASARELNALVHRWFDEQDVYRIDHFLGKETVQNLLVLRFANSIFESLWNQDRIDNVQITVAEEMGVGTRAGYYDGVGAMRDMVQNHLTQILTMIAMEVPVAYDAQSIHSEKIKVLRALRPADPGSTVYGRYGAGRQGDEELRAYLDEERVSPGSQTETFAALRLEIESWRWQGVPFYLRTGKRMARPLTEIAITFKRPPVRLFRTMDFQEVDRDVLVITLQPDEGFTLTIDVKRPGTPLALERIPLDYRYGEAFGELPDAYVTLLLDVLQGDQTLFVHASEVELAWQAYQPLIDARMRVHDYEPGSWGPRQADQLLARDGRTWRNLPS